ncbi:MAG: ATP-binding protein [Bacteroidales bacterium]|nr:ATP-binding protein [Bacteroidales bacterium]
MESKIVHILRQLTGSENGNTGIVLREGAGVLHVPFMAFLATDSNRHLYLEATNESPESPCSIIDQKNLVDYFNGNSMEPIQFSVDLNFNNSPDNTFIVSRKLVSMAAVHVVQEDIAIGLLVVGDKNHRVFSREDLNLLLIFGDLFKLILRKEEPSSTSVKPFNKYKAVFDHSSNGVLLFNDNVVVDANPMACSMFEMSLESIIGLSTDDLSPDDYIVNGCLQHSDVTKYTEKTLLGESQKFEWVHQKKTGGLFTTEVTLKKIEGQPDFNILGIINDISLRKEYEYQLIKAKDEAREANRLKSASLASMSHEIRTPLNSIIGFSDLLLETDVSEEDRETFTKLIMVAGKSLVQLVADIIDISKIEAGQVMIHEEEFELNNFLQEIYQTFIRERMQLENQDVELRLAVSSSENILLKTDQLRLRQIFNNLITNALKFVDEGYVEFGYSSIMPGTLLFYVKDTGVGIEKSKQKVIFSQYGQDSSTYQRNREGTGLGLAISKSFVELLGGKIWLDSETGSGSTFYFTIPIGQDQINLEIPVNEQGAFNVDLTGKKVLIVDDIQENSKLLIELFRKTNAELLVAGNGLEAINLARSNSTLDLAILDIRMPVMDGYETARILRQEFPEIVLMSLTAYPNSDGRAKCMACGFNEYISKPLMLQELIQLLQQYFH